MLSLSFPDALLTITIVLALAVALSGVVAWVMARNDKPANELDEEN